MADVSREELDAKLHGVTIRTEGLLAEIKAIVDGLARRLDVRDAATQRLWTERQEAYQHLVTERQESYQRELAERQAAYQREWAEYKRTQAALEAVREQRVQRIEKIGDDIRVLVENQKRTIIVTAITAVIATVLGVGSFNAALLSNMLAALSYGKEAAELLAETKKHGEQQHAVASQILQTAIAQNKHAAEVLANSIERETRLKQLLERREKRAPAREQRP